MKSAQFTAEISENRPLSPDEARLLRWLLEHGKESASAFLAQADAVRVVSRCGCGCASINFSVGDGGWHSRSGGMDILSDYQWSDSEGRVFGVFVFAKQRMLAGLEVWSIDGQATPTSLPEPSELRPL
jgi:hypothetical protein